MSKDDVKVLGMFLLFTLILLGLIYLGSGWVDGIIDCMKATLGAR